MQGSAERAVYYSTLWLWFLQDARPLLRIRKFCVWRAFGRFCGL